MSKLLVSEADLLVSGILNSAELSELFMVNLPTLTLKPAVKAFLFFSVLEFSSDYFFSFFTFAFLPARGTFMKSDMLLRRSVISYLLSLVFEFRFALTALCPSSDNSSTFSTSSFTIPS